MFRRLLPVLLLLPAALHAQALGDIRGSISPNDARSARYLNTYPQTEQQAFQDYQPVYTQPAYGYTAPDNPAVTVYSPDLGPKVSSGVARGGADPYRSYTNRASLLATKGGIAGGLNFSNYHYQEPSLPMKLDGLRYGAELEASFVVPDAMQITPMSNWFATASGRFSYGQLDYEGSGTAHDKNDYYIDARIVGGHDFLLGHNGFSPYAGFGYRYLLNDLRGLTSTGAPGYRRESQYLYLPIGATIRADLFGDGSRVSFNGEYDYFLNGLQISHTGDFLPTGDITNKQAHAFGLRGGLTWEKNNWGIGPYFNYWHVERSTINCSITTGGSVCGLEPNNQSWEYGLRATYRFWNF